MVTELKHFFMAQGYQEMNTNNSQLTVLYSEQGFDIQVLILNNLLSGMELTKEQYLNILRQIERAFYQRGYGNVNLLSLICTKNLDRVREFCMESSYTSWIVEEQANRLIIYETQQPAFGEIQRQLENLLERRARQAYEYGRMQSETPNRPSGTRSFREIINRYPVVTIAIVVVNVLVYILLEMTGSSENSYHLYDWGANEYYAIFVQHQYYRLLTSIFLHAGPEHLLNNMFVLIIIGERLEKILGKYRYTIVYFATGILASIGSVLFNHWMGEIVIGVGASGAIFGVVGGVFYLVCRYRGAKTGITMNRMLIFVGLSLYSGIANSSRVDNMAHIVGFISGVVVTCLVDIIGRKKRIRRNK